MSLLPDSATFHERVQALFVTYRGRGVSLSPEDMELVDRWADAEVPFEVVARGIRLAAEKALWDAPEGTGQLRFLRACRRTVDAELAKYQKRAAGKTEAPEASLLETRHHKLVLLVRRSRMPMRWRVGCRQSCCASNRTGCSGCWRPNDWAELFGFLDDTPRRDRRIDRRSTRVLGRNVLFTNVCLVTHTGVPNCCRFARFS
jgi:hypothetical protein